MSLPRGVAKADNGALFFKRTREELAAWTDADLRARAAYVIGHISPDGGGLTYERSYVRALAVAEHRMVLQELARRGLLVR